MNKAIYKKMSSYEARPLDMPTIGNDYYYPLGIPQGSSNPNVKATYIDATGRHFYICYTNKQILQYLQNLPYGSRNEFLPYVPKSYLGKIIS